MPLAASDAAGQGQDADAGTLDRLLRAIRDRRRRILVPRVARSSLWIQPSATSPQGGHSHRRQDHLRHQSGLERCPARWQCHRCRCERTPSSFLGMIDCHRHAWEGLLRRVIPNGATIDEYMGATHRGFARYYRPRRHVYRQSDHGARLHRRGHHLLHRQLAQFALARSFRCGYPGAVRFRYPRRACFRRADVRGMGSPMAGGPGTAAARVLFHPTINW